MRLVVFGHARNVWCWRAYYGKRCRQYWTPAHPFSAKFSTGTTLPANGANCSKPQLCRVLIVCEMDFFTGFSTGSVDRQDESASMLKNGYLARILTRGET